MDDILEDPEMEQVCFACEWNVIDFAKDRLWLIVKVATYFSLKVLHSRVYILLLLLKLAIALISMS